MIRTTNGGIVKISTSHDVIRVGVKARDGNTRTWEVFTIPNIEALERALKAAREKIARKRTGTATR
jgi:hypothetical protein